MKISGVSLLICLATCFSWSPGHGQKMAKAQEINAEFKGQVLAISDADMLATAYADGVLNKVEGIEDSLSLIRTLNGKPKLISQEMVTNSVVSWPSIIAWNKSLKLAYVAETRGIHASSEQKVTDVWKDLPKGGKISVVDYSDFQNPKTIQSIDVGENIQGVSVNSDATLIVAGSTEKGKEIMVAKLVNGKLEERFHFSNDEIKEVEDNNSGIRTIEFHPTENIIAANLNNTHLVFYRVAIEGEKVSLEQLGPSLEVAKHWSVGNWHPSGNYFILTDVAWGKGTLGAILNGKGRLVSIAFKENESHKIVSKTKVGLSPEGFDISPDGKYAVVANMRRTYAPKKFWFVPARKNSSLSLVKINENTGELTNLGKPYGFEGALPEDAVFDLESNSIAVAVFHKQDEKFPTKGWVDFWELKNEKLIKTKERLFVTRGVHNLLLIN